MANVKTKAVNKNPVEEELLDTYSNTLRETMESVTENSDNLINGMISYQRELTNFLSHRLNEDIKMQEKLFECRTFFDVAQLQGQFLDKAVNQYSKETAELMKMSTNLMAREFSTASEHMKSITPDFEDTKEQESAT